MRCRECDYSLWRIPGRACPECGAAFQPSAYDFVPNAVCFRCPHCAQEYYGRDQRGHLHPVEFDCVSCGEHVHMDEMVLEPTAGVTEERTLAISVPWFDRATNGMVGGWWRTIGHAHVRPALLAKGLPNRSMFSSTFGFCVITQLLVCVIRFVISAAMMAALFGLATWQGGGPGGGMGLAGVIGAAVASSIAWVIGTLLLILLLGAITHGALVITGSRAGGIGRTYDAYLLSSGALLLSALPSCLSMIGVVWWLVSATIAVSTAQRVSGIRAFCAVCLPPILAFVLLIGGMFWFMMAAVGAMNTAATAQVATATATADSVTMQSSVTTWVTSNRAYPTHALELILSDDADPIDFCGSDTTLVVQQIPLEPGVTLMDLDREPESSTSRAVVTRAIAKLPADVTAHRLGDFVFTWHGVPPTAPAGTNTAAHGQLWIAAFVPEPGLSIDISSSRTHHVAICADGTVTMVPIGAGTSPELDAQNALRAQFGLPALPNLETVTHAAPARAGN